MPYELSRRLGAGPLLCDGAMGTLLYARGVSLDACFDVLNLNNPRVVQSIHADYIAAGADCIETNTFGANRFKLAIHGLEGQVREVNQESAAHHCATVLCPTVLRTTILWLWLLERSGLVLSRSKSVCDSSIAFGRGETRHQVQGRISIRRWRLRRSSRET